MPLNIKHPEAHELAKALQRETGETMTRAVTEALRERLVRVRRQSKKATTSEELLTIGRRCARTRKSPAVDHATLLYDERGLPR
jgi:antitoxin VapB